jgi:hypothetical protein
LLRPYSVVIGVSPRQNLREEITTSKRRPGLKPTTPVDRDKYVHALVSKVKELAAELNETPSRIQFTEAGASDYQIRLAGGYEAILKMAGLESKKYQKKKLDIEQDPSAKILIFDIETSPMELYGYGLFDQNFSVNQIKKDWFVLSWAAKWLGSPEEQVMYADAWDEPDLSIDYGIVSQIWQLLDEADIVVTQNGIKFDSKKLNARFIKHGFPPPSPYRHIDTYRIGKKNFGFTSYKLEYMTGLLCKKYKKLTHSEFAGFDLWRAFLERNDAARACMEKYNRYDVLSLEELYIIMRPWDKTINFSVFSDGNRCSCGSVDFTWSGYDYTNAAKKDRFLCNGCGQTHVARTNLLDKDKKKSLLK